MSRVKKPKQVEEGLEHEKEDLRFGTPKLVADYRAGRLKCDTIVEVGAGVGFQTVAFARKCKKVIAIEVDERKAELLKRNVQDYKNVKVIVGDALDKDVVEKCNGANIVFVDTERPPEEKERKMESIRPNVNEILQKYSKITENICVEIPPQQKGINLNCEKEYVSLDGKLNRLNLYFGKLKKSKASVMLLPKGITLKSGNKPKPEILDSPKGFKFIYEINPAVILANLIGEVADGNNIIVSDNKPYLVSKKKLNSPFLKCYSILNVCNENEVKESLKGLDCKGVVLRYRIDPKNYWNMRKGYEKGLEGTKTLNLFKFNEEVAIGEAC